MQTIFVVERGTNTMGLNGKMKRGVSLIAILLGAVVACQPNTRQDRATVGPETTPVAADSANDGGGNSAAATPSTGDTAAAQTAVATNWEASQKANCDAGKPSGCSTLAFDAERAQQISAAIRLFSRACLLDESVGQCSQSGQQSAGLPRSCFEAARLYEQQGRIEDARSFRVCACARGYKPACAASL